MPDKLMQFPCSIEDTSHRLRTGFNTDSRSSASPPGACGRSNLTPVPATSGLDAKAALFWAFVGIPLAWGVWITLKNAIRIF
jgi:hypothetical protein